ncbi:MAG: hypothetical protein J7604_18035 [Sporocytophaga sp.]|uniref:hypothetical protein n=1 Tax=Sporocytophaga sp. TaxID=2231183 RepID=UPI001B0B777C|nr:hypothetical protein [Sporocytophaga sp.]MBO9702114.1 hypothetical protein [Sporocytophaga sp.]
MRRFKFLAIALCIMSLAACTEIFEKDIEDKEITIYTPSGKDSLNYTQTFWWSQIDFATSYHLQVVSPDFSAPQKMILDTIVKTNRFPYYLGPGNFEWKVRAMNGAYKTKYFGNKFKIDTTELALQIVNLTSPANGTSQNSSSIIFTWNKLLGAKTYQIQIDTNGRFNSLVKNEFTQAVSYPMTLPVTNKTYYWKVRALNGKDTTDWSTVYNIFWDNTTPPKIVLSVPSNNAVDKETSGTLQWASLGSGYTYYVTIKVGSNASVVSSTTTNSYSYSGASGQNVQWSVYAVNSANTKGPASDTWTFKIK